MGNSDEIYRSEDVIIKRAGSEIASEEERQVAETATKILEKYLVSRKLTPLQVLEVALTIVGYIIRETAVSDEARAQITGVAVEAVSAYAAEVNGHD